MDSIVRVHVRMNLKLICSWKLFSICGVTSHLLEMLYRITKSKVLTFVITMKKYEQKVNTDLLTENVLHNVRWAAWNGI